MPSPEKTGSNDKLFKMSGINNYCFTDLPPHEQVLCNAYMKGGIDSIGLFETDATIASFSSEANWNTAIAAGNARIIKGIKAEYPDATPVEGENPIACGNETVIDLLEHVMNVMDFNVGENNDDFWSAANGRTFYLAIHECMHDEIIVWEVPVTVFARPANIPMSNKEKQRYNVELKWTSDIDNFGTRYTAPNNIFE